jgi:hypothetical protein
VAVAAMSGADLSESRARGVLNDLIRQRQRLQSDAADAGTLEANRLAIVYWQWQLSRTLAGRKPGASAAA